MTWGKWIGLGGACALLAIPALAAAQQQPPSWYDESDKGVEAQLQAGAQWFPGGANGTLGSAFTWGAIVGIEPWPMFGLELGYTGADYGNVGQAGARASVLENGGYGGLKFSPRIGRFEPYLMGGWGVWRFEVQAEQTTNRENLTDDTFFKVPVALGLDFHFGADETPEERAATHLTLGVRGSYAFVFDNDFVPTTPRGADQLAATGVVGVQF